MKHETISTLSQSLIKGEMRATSLDRCLIGNESSVLAYLSFLGVRNENLSLSTALWCGLLTFVFASYFVCYTVEFFIGLILKFSDFFWVVCAVMMLKCVLLYVAIRRIRTRLGNPVFKNFLVQIEEAIHKSKLYFYITIFFNFATITLNIITETLNGESTFLDIYFHIMLAIGSTVFTGYMAAVILFSVADARVAQDTVKHLIRVTEKRQMNPQTYLDALTGVNKIVEDSFWLDGALIFCVFMNSVAAVVLLLIFDDLTNGESVFYTVAFIIYILMMMWITDLVFLVLVVPEIAKVNDLFIDFHRVLARAVNANPPVELLSSVSVDCSWQEEEEEDGNETWRRDSYIANRNNTLHLLISDPIRYTIAGGVYLNTREFWHRVLAMVAAVGFAAARMVFLFIASP